MATLAAFLFAALLGALGLKWGKLRYGHGPFQIACSCTLVGIVPLIAGLSGFRLRQNPEALVGGQFTHAVVWPQVGFGLVMLSVSLYFWQKALKKLRSEPSRNPS